MLLLSLSAMATALAHVVRPSTLSMTSASKSSSIIASTFSHSANGIPLTFCAHGGTFGHTCNFNFSFPIPMNTLGYWAFSHSAKSLFISLHLSPPGPTLGPMWRTPSSCSITFPRMQYVPFLDHKVTSIFPAEISASGGPKKLIFFPPYRQMVSLDNA